MTNEQTKQKQQKKKERITVELDKLIAAIAFDDTVLDSLKSPSSNKPKR